jgi:hypothetical protein
LISHDSGPSSILMKSNATDFHLFLETLIILTGWHS